jgi:hypothetical protein
VTLAADSGCVVVNPSVTKNGATSGSAVTQSELEDPTFRRHYFFDSNIKANFSSRPSGIREWPFGRRIRD